MHNDLGYMYSFEHDLVVVVVVVIGTVVQDVIPGLMSWKKFSSPCLAALEKEKKLASYWKPCLSDPFTTGLLPCLPVEQTVLMAVPKPDDSVDRERYIVVLM